MMRPIRVYVDTVRRFCRPNNTDWRYNFNLARLTDYAPHLSFYYPGNGMQELRVNAKYLRKALAGHTRRTLGLGKPAAAEPFTDLINERELQASDCEIVFSHRDFPVNTSNVPVVWQNSILDPRMYLGYGGSPDFLTYESAVRRKLFAHAAIVLVSTHAKSRSSRAGHARKPREVPRSAILRTLPLRGRRDRGARQARGERIGRELAF